MSLPACNQPTPWWLGDALTVDSHGLLFEGIHLAEIVKDQKTPVYVYGTRTLQQRLRELREALSSTGTPFRIHYAMKASRFLPLLSVFHREGDIGIDACSPREVEQALAAGFPPEVISVTVTMPSNRDLAFFAGQGVHVNLDTRSALRRFAALGGRGQRVGLRINPMVRIGWNEQPKLSYGESKFGFDSEITLDAAAYAASLGLVVDELHIHAGWGLPAKAAPQLATAFENLAALGREIPTVRTLNVGGGLGWKQRPEDDPLSPTAWAGLLRTHIAPTGCTIACEPGTFLVHSAGVLVAEVTTVEKRKSGTWIGLDVGHNVNCHAAHYGIPMAIVSVARPLWPHSELVHVAGNINEANDVFAHSVHLPRIEEGELVVFYPAGAYGASMASDHCLRGLPAEILV